MGQRELQFHGNLFRQPVCFGLKQDVGALQQLDRIFELGFVIQRFGARHRFGDLIRGKDQKENKHESKHGHLYGKVIRISVSLPVTR